MNPSAIFFKLSIIANLFWLYSGIVACTPRTPRDPSALIIGIEAYPDQRDPRLATDALSHKINQLIYSGLFRINTQLELEPDLAEAVEFIDNQTLQIRLREAQFHNGQRLTSQDVQATYDSIKVAELLSPHRRNFELIKKIVILDEQNFRLYLTEPFAPLLTSLTMGILPASTVKEGFVPIGTGPYRITQTALREKIALEANPYYYRDPPRIARLVFRTIFDDSLRTLELVKGRLDLVQNAIPHALLPYIEKQVAQGHLQWQVDVGTNLSYMGLNLRDPSLRSLEVRQAIAHGINREEIIRYKLKNLATPATSLLSPQHWAHHSGLPVISYDPERSRQLLDRAGFIDPDGEGPRSRFKLIYKTSSKKDRVMLAQLIADQLKQIGIEVIVEAFEWGTFFRDIRIGNFQLYTLTWVGVTEPDIYYYAFHSGQIPPEGANRGYYENSHLDRLVEQGRGVYDRESRQRVYHEVQLELAHDLPFIPLWYEGNIVVMQNHVRGYKLRPDASFLGLATAQKE